MCTSDDSPPGKARVRADHYDPSLLFPIPRAIGRRELGIGASLPFHGIDIWNAYELSWLDTRGKPQVAIARFDIPASSPQLIESKSFKLYLNSFSQQVQPSIEALRTCLRRDLSAASEAVVDVMLYPTRTVWQTRADLIGTSIDDLPVIIDDYAPPRADYLRAYTSMDLVEEVLVSDLLRSNCPVTGQPDWASIQLAYRGHPIDHEGLLRYLVSFRSYSAFHEQCVERIFMDIRARCIPTQLAVYARYTRRGGLDINPYRSTTPDSIPANPHGARQ